MTKRLLVPLVTGTAFATIVLAGRFAGIPASELTRDVTSMANLPPWAGILAAAGVLAWAAAAAIGAFSASLLPRRSDGRRYLGAIAAIAAALAFDDQFRFSQIAHNVTDIPEAAFLAAYAIAMTTVLAIYWRTVVASDLVLLALVGLFLGSAVAFDVLSIRESIEDLLKVVGAATLAEYVRTTASMHLNSLGKERSQVPGANDAARPNRVTG